MPDVPNLRHLSAVAEVAQLGTLSRAAAAVHMSQSALTQALRKVEGLTEQALFQRTTAGMDPTSAGRLFVARLERAFRWLKSYERDMSPRHPRGSGSLFRVMTATQLKSLVAVTESGGFTLAARHLGISQPSVYRAAKELEKLCGESFFIRSHQGIEPTPAAHRLARCASLAFAEIRQAFEELNELRGKLETSVVVGCLPLARVHVLPASVNRLLQIYPAARIRIVDGPYDELLNALRHGHLDLIIGALRIPPPAEDICQEVLFEDPLSIVVRVGHPVLSHPGLNPRRLAKLDWIVPREGTPAREQFTHFFTSRGVAAPRQVIECSSLVATRGLLLGSNRAALLSAHQVKIEVASRQLAVLPKPLPGTSRPIGMTFRSEWRPTRIQDRLLAIVRDVAHEIVAS